MVVDAGHIHLHRLSWQKVWQVPLTVKEEPAVPELMAWHPEGLFLVVASGIQRLKYIVHCWI